MLQDSALSFFSCRDFKTGFYHHFLNLSQMAETIEITIRIKINPTKDQGCSLNGIPARLTPSKLVINVIGVNIMVNSDIK